MFVRNAWYCAATPAEVGRQPMGRLILNEPIVLYRKEDGTATALEDRCRHRATPLHRGKLIGDAIQCPYHGFQFDAEGLCIKVPAQPETPRNLRVRHYPLAEKHGWLWIWMGEAALADPATIPDFHTNDDPAWAATGDLIRARGNYLLFVENLIDLSHVAFVHASTIGSDDDVGAKLDFDRGDDFVRVTRTAPTISTPPTLKPLGFGPLVDQLKIITFWPPCHVLIEVLTVDAGRADDPAAVRSRTMILNTLTPETDVSTHYFWAHNRDFATDKPELTTYIHGQVVKAFDEDRDIIEAQQRNLDLDPDVPMISVGADWGGLQARRMVRRLIEAEAAPAVAAE
jgi:vanillate O-demethylase monooxygenase subunit